MRYALRVVNDQVPSISGALACGLRDVAAELVGDQAVIGRALARLPEEARIRYSTATAIEWMPIDVMEAAFTEIAGEIGSDVATFHERVANISIERTLRTVWRLLLRLTSDRALVSRTPSVFARSYNRGRLVAAIPEPGRGEISLLDWPGAPAWPIRATRIGIATVLRVAGRNDVRVDVGTTPTGARYIATWR